MKKYEVRIKKAGWEKEKIVDQLFVPPPRSVNRNPDKLELNPFRYKPIRNRINSCKRRRGYECSIC